MGLVYRIFDLILGAKGFGAWASFLATALVVFAIAGFIAIWIRRCRAEKGPNSASQ